MQCQHPDCHRSASFRVKALYKTEAGNTASVSRETCRAHKGWGLDAATGGRGEDDPSTPVSLRTGSVSLRARDRHE